MFYLFDHLSIAAEDSQWCASVVRSYVVFLPTAHLHSKQMPLIIRQLEIRFILLLYVSVTAVLLHHCT